MPRIPVLSALTRGQRILAGVAVVIVALYITGIAARDDSQGGDPTENSLVKTLSGWFGQPDPVELSDLSGPCLTGSTLTIKDSCLLTVASSSADLRDLLLRPDAPLHVHTRAPQSDSVVDKDVAAGEQIKVSVDDKGAQITLTCACTVTVGGGNG